jgi:formate dehydrogenase subunit gamma
VTESDTVRRIIAELKGRPGPLLEVLHAIQSQLGYGAVLAAEMLNLPPAEVHGVVTFYHYFRNTPPGRQGVSVCQASRAGKTVRAKVSERIAPGVVHTTRDRTPA